MVIRLLPTDGALPPLATANLISWSTVAGRRQLRRLPSVRETVEDTLSAHRNELVSLLSRYVAQGKGILQPHHLLDELANVGGQKLTDSPFIEILRSPQEAIVLPSFVAIAVCPRPDVWEYVRVNVLDLIVDQLSVSEYLRFKEMDAR